MHVAKTGTRIVTIRIVFEACRQNSDWLSTAAARLAMVNRAHARSMAREQVSSRLAVRNHETASAIGTPEKNAVPRASPYSPLTTAPIAPTTPSSMGIAVHTRANEIQTITAATIRHGPALSSNALAMRCVAELQHPAVLFLRPLSNRPCDDIRTDSQNSSSTLSGPRLVQLIQHPGFVKD